MKRFFKGGFFALGPSTVLLMVLIFYAVPLVAFLDLAFRGGEVEYEIPWRTASIVTLGIISAVVGYLLPVGERGARRIGSTFGGSWNMKRVEVVFWLALLGGVAIKIVKVLAGGYLHTSIAPEFAAHPFFSTVGFLDWLGPISFAIALVGYFTQASRRRFLFYAWGAFAVEFLYAVPTCGKMEIITPILMFLVIRSVFVGFRWRYVLGTVLFAALLFPFGNACRNIGFSESYRAFGSLSGSGAMESRANVGSAVSFATQSIIGRTNYLGFFSRVIDSDLPTRYGSSLRDFVVSSGPPGFLWKNKPSISAGGNEFGRRIGVLAPDNYHTSVAPTVIGGWYLEFGVPGVFWGMLLLGIIWRFLYEWLVGMSLSPSGILAYSVVWLVVVKSVEEDLAPPYAGLSKLLVLLLAIHVFVRDSGKGKLYHVG